MTRVITRWLGLAFSTREQLLTSLIYLNMHVISTFDNILTLLSKHQSLLYLNRNFRIFRSYSFGEELLEEIYKFINSKIAIEICIPTLKGLVRTKTGMSKFKYSSNQKSSESESDLSDDSFLNKFLHIEVVDTG